MQNVARRLISMFVLALGSVLALDVMGATALVGAVLGTAGIVGLALGFAFKDSPSKCAASNANRSGCARNTSRCAREAVRTGTPNRTCRQPHQRFATCS